jgi:hypothetical protein
MKFAIEWTSTNPAASIPKFLAKPKLVPEGGSVKLLESIHFTDQPRGIVIVEAPDATTLATELSPLIAEWGSVGTTAKISPVWNDAEAARNLPGLLANA